MPVPTGPIHPIERTAALLCLLADVLMATVIVAVAGAVLCLLALLVTHPQWSTAEPGTALVDPCRTEWTEDARFVSPCATEPESETGESDD